MKFIFTGSSQKNQRPTNQDSLYVKYTLLCGIPSLLAIVCDGVGSLKYGELAGVTAVTMLKKWFELELPNKIGIDNNIKNAGIYLTTEINIINKKIKKISKSINVKTAATISVMLIIGNKYYIAHLGDSRIYKFNNTGIFQLTEDHILKNDYTISKKFQNSMNPNLLTRYLGYYGKIEIFYSDGILKRNDSFMLCSDGFYRKTNIKDIKKKLKKIKTKLNLSDLINNQIQTVIRNGEQDNISLIIIKII